jgi:hypothetical protein
MRSYRECHHGVLPLRARGTSDKIVARPVAPCTGRRQDVQWRLGPSSHGRIGRGLFNSVKPSRRHPGDPALLYAMSFVTRG